MALIVELLRAAAVVAATLRLPSSTDWQSAREMLSKYIRQILKRLIKAQYSFYGYLEPIK